MVQLFHGLLEVTEPIFLGIAGAAGVSNPSGIPVALGQTMGFTQVVSGGLSYNLLFSDCLNGTGAVFKPVQTHVVEPSPTQSLTIGGATGLGLNLGRLCLMG